MKISVKSKLQTFVICFAGSMITANICAAGSLLMNASWDYSTASDAADTGTFSQIYSTNYSGSTDLTDLVRLSGALRYSKLVEEEGIIDRISPYLSLNNANDIYRLGISGNYSVTIDENDMQSETWNWSSSLSNSWQEGLFLPSLIFNVGQSGSSSDTRDGSLNTRTGARIDYGYFGWVRLGYDVNWSAGENRDTGHESESLSQTARLNASKDFFDNRLGLSFSQVYQNTDQESSGTVGVGGFFLNDLNSNFSQLLYEETNDHTANTLDNDASSLLTGTAPTLPINPDPINFLNIGLQTNLIRVDEIHVATTVDINAYACNIDWDLYSSPDGSDWIPEIVNIPCVYNPMEQRYEFDVNNQVHQYLKLVADASAVLPVTQIESITLYRRVLGAPGMTVTRENQRSNSQTNAGFNYLMTKNIRLNYNFSYSQFEDDLNLDSENTGHHSGLSWKINKYLDARLNASWNEQQVETLPANLNKTYNFSLSSRPLPTLNISAGFNRNESYPGASDDYITNTYGIYSTAELYKDLQGALSFSYSTVEEGTGDDTWGTTARLTARLRPTLLLSFDNDYSQSIDSGNYGNTSSIRLNWRASDLFNISNYVSVGLQSDQSATMDYRFSASLNPNWKNRLSLNYGYAHAPEEDTHRIGANWQYLINPVFNFQLGGGYLIGDLDSSWTVNARLNAQYRNN